MEIKIIEQTIGILTADWHGKCHEIASLLLTKNLTTGKLRYGHWLGPVHPNSIFACYPHGLVHHGWIEREDGSIVDPTRFEFEQLAPYIYMGKNDYYDAGGNQIKLANLRPSPPWNQSDKRELVILKDNNHILSKFIKENIDCRSTKDTIIIQVMQACWLANLPLQILEDAAKPVYAALIEAGEVGLIPYDNRHMIMDKEET